MGKDYSKKETTIEDAKKWYESFLEALEFEGIDLSNPYALGLVNVANPIGDLLPKENEPRKTIEEAEEYIQKSNDIFKLAFIPVNGDENYLIPRNSNTDAATWIKDSTSNPEDLSDEQIIRLYEAAKNNRLMLQSTKLEPEFRRTVRLFFVDENGLCGVTGVLGDNKKRNIDALARCGFTQEDAADAASYMDDLISVEQSKQEAVFDNLADAADNPDSEYTKEQFREDMRTKFNQFTVLDLIVKRGAEHPDWLETPERRKEISDAAAIMAMSASYRTNKQNRATKDVSVIGMEGEAVTSSLIKFFNPHKDPHGRRIITVPFNDMFRSGRIADSNGNIINSGDSLTDANSIDNMLNEYHAVFIDKKPYCSYLDFGLMPAAKVSSYLSLMDQCREEIAKALEGADDSRLHGAELLKKIETNCSQYRDYTDNDISCAALKADLRTINESVQKLSQTIAELPDATEQEKNIVHAFERFTRITDCASRNLYEPTEQDLESKGPSEQKNDRKVRAVNSDIFLPPDQQIRKDLDRISFGPVQSGQANDAKDMVPLIASDCSRICRYDASTGKMTYPFFDDKANAKFEKNPHAHWDFLAKQNPGEALEKGDCIYFKAGKEEGAVPYRIKNGKLEKINLSEIKDLKFRRALNDEINQRLLSDNDYREEQLQRERQLFNYRMARTGDVFSQLLGTQPGRTGSEVYRDFSETINHALEIIGEDFSYPKSEEFSEDDIIALTSLSFANPDVNGTKNPASTKEASALGSFNIWPADFFIQRSGKTDQALEELKDARRHTKELLTEYAKTKDDGLLARELIKTLHTASLSGCRQAGLTDTDIGTLMPAHYIAKFIRNHQNLVVKAMEALKNNADELDRFKQGMKNIAAQENIYNAAQKTADISLSPTDRKDKRDLIELLNFEGQYYDRRLKKLSTEKIRSREQQFNRDLAASKDPKEMARLSEAFGIDQFYLEKSTMPDYPLRVLFQDNDTAQKLNDIIAGSMISSDNSIEPELLYNHMESLGGIPKRPEYECDENGCALDTKVNNSLYEDYLNQVRGENPKVVLRQISEEFEKLKLLNKATKSVLVQLNLKIDDVVVLAASHRVSASDYLCSLYEENMNAEWATLTPDEKLSELEKDLEIRGIHSDPKALENISDKIIELTAQNKAMRTDPKVGQMIESLGKIYASDPEKLGRMKDADKLLEIERKALGTNKNAKVNVKEEQKELRV